MKVHNYDDGQDQRDIVIAMIVNDVVLGKIAAKWENGNKFPQGATWANLVAQWCVDFYVEYHKAPCKEVEVLFQSWKETKSRDSDTIELVNSFLGTLNREYEQRNEDFNPESLVKRAGRYFNKVKLRRLHESLGDALDLKDWDKAKSLLDSFHSIDIASTNGRSPLLDDQVLVDALSHREHKTLIEFPGAMGQLFRNRFERDGFISIEGPEKRGKSFFLLDLAFRAVQHRRKVAFFSLGDMSEDQVHRRFFCRMFAHPLDDASSTWPYTVRIPVGIKMPDKDDLEGIPEVECKEKIFKRPLSVVSGRRYREEFLKRELKSHKEYFKTYCCSQYSTNVQGIRSILRGWEVDGFEPSVVVIDYADILGDPVGRLDKRDQINRTWGELRALSTDLNGLVITATQSSAKAYKKKTLDHETFSEDKRKRSHVTGSIGLNQTAKEKEFGLMRLNWIMLREGESHVNRCVTVAQCLPLGNPCVISTL